MAHSKAKIYLFRDDATYKGVGEKTVESDGPLRELKHAAQTRGYVRIEETKINTRARITVGVEGKEQPTSQDDKIDAKKTRGATWGDRRQTRSDRGNRQDWALT